MLHGELQWPNTDGFFSLKPSKIIPQNFSSSGLVVSEELGNKQTHKLTDILLLKRIDMKRYLFKIAQCLLKPPIQFSVKRYIDYGSFFYPISDFLANGWSNPKNF